jgi:NADH-quinone oxidoreductase subunit I/electron transport complex protein RnfC
MAMQIPRGKVIEMERGGKRLRAGQGLLKGLGVIWHHWSKSWTDRLTRFDQIAGTFTVEYPEQRIKIAEAYRNSPVLLYDEETGHEFCTSCFQCERVCPPQVIHMTQAKDPATGKPVPAVTEFIIEYDACMGCGLCHEVCPFEAIKMDSAYELSSDDHPAMTVHKRELLRPVSYYEQIAPTMWEQVKENAYKKLEATKKRRSGTLGIAPQAIEAGTVASPPPPPAPETEGANLAPAVAGDAKAPDAPKKLSPEEKAAKLEAIRAAKAAKKAAEGGEGGESSETPPAADAAGESTSPPADDKAAKLAAIRARNVARKAAEAAEGGEGGESSETPPPTETTGESTTPPADDKAAKLAAIRARNAAKKKEQEEQQKGQQTNSEQQTDEEA